MAKLGKFISFEGIDGAGKSTHITWVQKYLQQKNINAVIVREPGSTPLGEALREILLRQTMRPLTETLLMFSARNELVEKIIKPSLAQGEWVISDRFVDASYAYQGGGRGISTEVLDWLREKCVGETMPDITFLFSASTTTAEKRRQSQKSNPDRFESENNNFFELVSSAYQNCQNKEPSRIININSEREIEIIRAELATWLDKLI